MIKYVARRVLALVPVLFGVAFIVFTLLYITPGDPAKLALGQQATDEALQEFRDRNGLDDPFLVQFGRYISNAVFRGDIGRSYVTKRPVSSEIMDTFKVTLRLAVFSMAISIVLGIPFGIISAIKQYSIFDSITMVLALVGISMPVFWLGLLLILLFSVHLGWFPSSGMGSFAAMVLPSLSLSAQGVAIITRMTRSSMLEVVRQDYIRTARAKGQKESVVIWRHALPNALIPVVTVIGIHFGYLLGGAVLTESVFSIPGVGRLMVEAIKMRDYPIVQGGVLYIAIAYSLVNLLVDLVYGWIDPRIKAQYR
ncbi:binding-protein-dependent transport systems inner membrane component [Dethiosulfovibrio peptidovorans DSM 11002]|uniref:Binding-protein-dependent transport systems inner membrane component n=1 Tax=Dethiosulfovibrio peptidovorans DSM 11002 TaxID=469381 RepID=D2Z6R4_9BACT|nr:nickel ABC transporter permease [Dethiosulfovibrio peptidovorans]EFC91161.1 binding-protein-dependent transport systems inner membrane component [Dethiosulfovibrio peptidovorans DSM 11002]